MKYYTLLKQDGTRELFYSGKALPYDELRDKLGCRILELIPKDYYPDGMVGTLWGDEEGRFNPDNKRNPHTKVLRGLPEFGQDHDWDCVGDLILEQTQAQYSRWKVNRGN